MSHAAERKDKDCLNCGTIVQGRFCQNCGQENIVPHETFGHMVKHFFYDITHFDSKFLDSVRYLVTRPGFLPKEYMRGRRAHYLNPVKMYVFTSAIFFLIFYSLYTVKGDTADQKNSLPGQRMLTRTENYAITNAKTKEDSNAVKRTFSLIRKDTVKIDTSEKKNKTNRGFEFSTTDADEEDFNYKTVSEYDSVQKTLSSEQRDGWFERIVKRKIIDLSERYDDDDQFNKELVNKFLHTFPYILFISLPLYALFLKLLYRRSKNYFFVDHGIFLIHLYVFTFILMLFVIAVDQLGKALDQKWPVWIIVALILFGIWYAYKSMRNFYEQRRGKTILKFILFNILCFVSIIILFTLFLLVTFFQV